jgi:signal transduction histidine kinase
MIGLTELLGLALAAALLLAGGLGWLYARESKARVLAARSARTLDEMLGFSPNGWYRWDEGGQENCSRRLAVLLDLRSGTEARFDEILRHFSQADQAALNMAVTGLRKGGAGFSLEMPLLDLPRRIRFSGSRIADEKDRFLADVLWAEDITQNTETVDRLSAEMFVLLAERDRLRAVLNAVPMPVWLREANLKLAWCNRAYAQAVDAISPAAAIADARELAPEAYSLAEQAKREGAPRTISRHLVIDGSRRMFEICETPLPGGGAGVAHDMTRLEDVKGELARHVAAHAEVLERLAVPIAIHGGDTRLVFFNTAFQRLTGLESGWLGLSPSYLEVLDALRERRRLPEQADWSAYREEELKRFTGLIDPYEDIIHLPDGQTLRRLIAPHPFGGLLFTYENVTDKLALERSFNTLTAVHRETLDSLNEAVAVFGDDGRLKLYNQAFAQTWAAGPDELALEPHFTWFLDRQAAFLSEPERPVWREKLGRLFSGRAAGRDRLARADGATLDQAALPLPDGGILLTWHDVTDTARVQTALVERNAALEAANRLKSEFIANVSTELRAPLETVIGATEILSGDYYGQLNSRQAEYVKSVLDSARHLKSLIDDIVDLATIEAGRMTLELDTFEIAAMLAGVLALSREAVKAKDLTLNFDCPPDIGWMAGDERRVKQVLYNLIHNAVKFTPPGGQITLAAQRQGKNAIFTVADTGVGIPLSDQARLAQSIDQNSPMKSGGIGLVLVKRFVELHGGEVDIVSVPSEGTTVTLTLPLG